MIATPFDDLKKNVVFLVVYAIPTLFNFLECFQGERESANFVFGNFSVFHQNNIIITLLMSLVLHIYSLYTQNSNAKVSHEKIHVQCPPGNLVAWISLQYTPIFSILCVISIFTKKFT